MRVSFLLLLSCLGCIIITSQAQDCPHPDLPANMQLEGANSNLNTFPNGTSVIVGCVVGYQPAGPGTITCQSGTWSRLRRQCSKNNCGTFEEIPNGHVDYSEGTEFGAKIVITCDEGFNLVGRGTIFCGASIWDGKPPVCEVLTCGPPPEIVNGDYTPKSEERYTYRSIVTYKCAKDYTLIGSKVLTCSANETFLPGPPTCIMVQCDEPHIKNGRQTDGAAPYSQSSLVRFKCDSGYTMKGKDTQTCEVGGWTPGLPVCEPIPVPPKTTKATPTSTTTTTTTTIGKKTPDPDITDTSKGNHLAVILGVLIPAILITSCCVWWFCLRGKHKRRSGGRSPESAAKEGEGVHLSPSPSASASAPSQTY